MNLSFHYIVLAFSSFWEDNEDLKLKDKVILMQIKFSSQWPNAYKKTKNSMTS